MREPPRGSSPEPPPARPGWWQRHWKWAVPLFVAIPLLLVFGAIFQIGWMLINDSMSDHDAYRFALSQARAERAVTAALGTPIEPDGLAIGSISTAGDGGYAHIEIPIAGPRGKATIFVDASSRLGVWRFATLAVTIDGTATPIDLMPALPAERRLSQEERARLMSEGDAPSM
jgi:hypothetical protein